MSLDPIFDVQQAIYDRLTTGVNKINYPVYDDIPDDPPNHVVELQPVNVQDNSAKTCPLHICIFFINCWTTDKQNSTISKMFNEISQSLTFSSDYTPNPLTISNFNFVGCYSRDRQINKQPDNSQFIYQGVMEVEIWVQETE